MRVTLHSFVRHSIAIIVLGGLAAVQMSGWLDPHRLPLFDFPGYVAVAEDVRNQILASGRVHDWSTSGFSGTSLYTSHFKELLSLPLVVALGALRGTQLYVFLLKLAAGLTLYAGFSRYLRAPAVGIVAGYAYTCSLSASYSAQNSDVMLALVLLPLIFIASLEMFRERSRTAAIFLGVLMACLLATNVIHALSAALIPILLGLIRPWSRTQRVNNPFSDGQLALIWVRRALLALAVFGCLGASQIAWFIWDQQHHAAHDPAYVEKVVSVYSEPSPFLLVNRANWMGAWLNEHPTPFQEDFPADSIYGQHHYLGIVSISIVLAGFWRARRTRALRRAYQLFGALFLIQWGLAIGPHSLSWLLAKTFSWPEWLELTLGRVFLAAALVLVLSAIRKWDNTGRRLTEPVEYHISAALVLAFIPTSLFLGLQNSSAFFDHFRAPGKFMELLPFSFYPAMGIGLVVLVRGMTSRPLARVFPALVLGLILVDTWPARSVFQVDHTLAPVSEFREKIAQLSARTNRDQPAGRLGFWPFASPSLWTEPSWIATASSLDGAWGWLIWQAGEYYRPFYVAAFRGHQHPLSEAARIDAQGLGNTLARIARVQYLLSEHDGFGTPQLSPPWRSIARNERFELWEQPDILPMSMGYRGHLIASGQPTWPLLASIALAHDKGLIVLMGDGRGATQDEALHETATLNLQFSVTADASRASTPRIDRALEPGGALTVGTRSSRAQLRDFLESRVPLTTIPVSYVRPSHEEIELEIEAGSQPAIVFVSESYHPGWTGFVDGVEKPVLRSQLTFMAIAIPEGRHTIRLHFSPPTAVRIADVVSGASWLALPVVGLGWASAKGRARRQARSNHSA